MVINGVVNDFETWLCLLSNMPAMVVLDSFRIFWQNSMKLF